MKPLGRVRAHALQWVNRLLAAARKFDPTPVTSFLTIVGGRGSDRNQDTGGVPNGIEQLMRKAAGDRKFRDALLDDPATAIARSGIPLTDIEKALILRTSPDRLDRMISGYGPLVGRRAVLGGALSKLLVSVAILTAVLFALNKFLGAGCATAGIMPGPQEPPAGTRGIRPQPFPEGIPRTAGIRPPPYPPSEGMPKKGSGSFPAPAGIRPEAPPRTLGIRPGD